MTPDLVDALYQAIVVAANRPTFQEDAKRTSANVTLMQPAKFQAYIDAEMQRYRKILPPLGIKLE